MNKSFTLVELLIVIGILAIITAAIIIVLNPAELLKQARDSKRLQDITSIDQSLQVAQAIYPDVDLGTASTVYVSVADTTSTCANLGLPSLPSGWTYNCVTSSNLINTDGTGWIPVNFQDANLVGAIQLQALPIDPTNTTSTGLYYTYVMGGSWEVTALTEADKHDAAVNDGGMFPGVLQKGSYLDATPGTRDNGLIGYWTFEEGSGSTAYDTSGNGGNVTLYNGTPHSSTNKVGSYSLNPDGSSNDYGSRSGSFLNPNSGTVSFWVYPETLTGFNRYYFVHYYDSGNALYLYSLAAGDGSGMFAVGNNVDPLSSGTIEADSWQHFVATYDNGAAKLYKNGGLISSFSYAGPIVFGSTFGISSSGNAMDGYVDDVRVYNRALSVSEIEAIYNATR